MPAPVLQFKRGNAGVAGTVPALRPGEPAISLNNFDFFIGIDTSVANNKFFGSHRYWGREDGTKSLRLNLVDKNGTNYVAVKSPDTLAGIVTYILPGTQGGNQTVLTNDGSGNLSWSSGSLNAVFSGITTIGGDFLDVNVNADFSGITTFSNTTDNTLGNPDTGAVQIDGGLGVNKNVTVGAGLSVVGQSYFIGTATFYGGTLNLGDSDGDNINVAGEFVSNLVPNATNTYDLGLTGKRWRDGYFSRNLEVTGNLTVDGNVSIGGSTVTLLGQDVYIKNKDIILGYTTSITNADISDDDTANHAGVAIASTVGSPLTLFAASGINTLPDTYKQLMWFKQGTLGFGTDAFAFNYGVAIGTTNMADGVRLAVGSGITMSDTAISATSVNATTVTATTGNFTNLTGSLTGTISTATRALTVDTTTAPNGTFYPGLFVNNTGTASTTVYVDAGISYVSDTDTLTLTGDIAVNGGDVTTSATTFNLVNGTATNVNFAGAATALVMGAATGITTISNNLTVGGDIRVNGNDIQASDGNTNITLTSNTLTTFAGDIKVTGNDIQSSSATAITLSGSDVTVAGDLQVTGNDIKSSTGAVAITLAANDVTITDDLTVGGNLYVNGSTTQVNTTALSVEDRTIELGKVDGATTSTTTWDLGVLFNYGDAGTARKSAVIWEHVDSRFKFAKILDADTDGTSSSTPQLTITGAANYAAIEINALWINDCAGQSQVISCTGTERFLENITVDAGGF